MLFFQVVAIDSTEICVNNSEEDYPYVCNGRRSAMTTPEPVHKEIYVTLKIPIELFKVKS